MNSIIPKFIYHLLVVDSQICFSSLVSICVQKSLELDLIVTWQDFEPSRQQTPIISFYNWGSCMGKASIHHHPLCPESALSLTSSITPCCHASPSPRPVMDHIPSSYKSKEKVSFLSGFVRNLVTATRKWEKISNIISYGSSFGTPELYCKQSW